MFRRKSDFNPRFVELCLWENLNLIHFNIESFGAFFGKLLTCSFGGVDELFHPSHFVNVWLFSTFTVFIISFVRSMDYMYVCKSEYNGATIPGFYLLITSFMKCSLHFDDTGRRMETFTPSMKQHRHNVNVCRNIKYTSSPCRTKI